jgi:hypothetical protein
VQTIAYVGGTVQATSVLDLGNRDTQVVNEIELRSPVRVNDQYTVLDMHEADSGVDRDGDGRVGMLFEYSGPLRTRRFMGVGPMTEGQPACKAKAPE